MQLRTFRFRASLGSVLVPFLFAVALGACKAPVGTRGVVSVPEDAAARCTAHCQSIGLPLESVVIMANNVGCVCKAQGAGATYHGGASSAGMAALMIEEEEQQNSTTSASRRRR
jgi:hypothetical protein